MKPDRDVLSWPDNHPKAKILGRTRQAIIAAARRLFLAQGFERTAMEGVAAAAEIGIMTLYRHFRSKAALFRSVMEAECGMQARYAETSNGDLWSLPPLEALTAFAQAVILVLVEPDQLALRRLVIAEAERFPELGRAWYEAGPARGVAELVAYLNARRAQGEPVTDDPHRFAEDFVAMLDRLPQQQLLGLVSVSADRAREEAARAAATLLAAASPR